MKVKGKKANIALILLLSALALLLLVLIIRQARLSGFVISESRNIVFNKEEFFPYETIQIELHGDFTSEITSDNVVIKQGSLKMPVKFYIEKISPDFYFAYATLTLSPGTYNVSITTRTQYGVDVYEKEITIKQTNNDFYTLFANNVADSWYSLSNKALIYATAAIKDIDKVQEKKAIEEVLRRENYFSDEEKILAVLLIKSENESWQLKKAQFLNYLLLNQDNNIGSFKIILNASSLFLCKIDEAEKTVENSTEIPISLLNATSINISIDCYKLEGNNTTNATTSDINKIDGLLVKEYINKKEYQLNKTLVDGENKFIRLYLQKEFGGFKDDVNLTSLLLFVLVEENQPTATQVISWLQRHRQSLLANIALASVNDVDAINYLLAQQNSDGSLPLNNPSAEMSCLTYKAGIPTRALLESWIKAHFAAFDIKDKAACLSLALKKQNILNVMPGAIKTKAGSSFSFNLTNKGIADFDVFLANTLLNLNHSIKLEKDKKSKITVNVPSLSFESNYLEEKIEIYYVDGHFSLPIFISAEANITNVTNATNVTVEISPETGVGAGAGAEAGREEEKKEEAKFNISIAPELIDLVTANETNITIKIKNNEDKKMTDVAITYSPSLMGVVKAINPPTISEIRPNQEKTVEIVFKRDLMDFYEGQIIVEGYIGSMKFEKAIDAKIKTQLPTAELKSCSSYNGTICKAGETCKGTEKKSLEGVCCVGKCEKKKATGKIVGIVFVVIGIAIIAYLIFSIKRKPKEKKIEEVLKKIEEKEKAKLGKPPVPKP